MDVRGRESRSHGHCGGPFSAARGHDGEPRVQFVPGDAFGFHPRRSVDWLLCDVIAPPDRSAQLLLEWLRRGWCRRFVVTLKLKDELGINVLDVLKRDLPPLTSELLLSHLCANKKEACVMGTRR